MRHRAGTLSLVSIEQAQRDAMDTTTDQPAEELDRAIDRRRIVRITFCDAHGAILYVREIDFSEFPTLMAEDYPISATVELVTREDSVTFDIPQPYATAPVWVAGPMTREEFRNAYPPHEPDPGNAWIPAQPAPVFGPAQHTEAQTSDTRMYPEFEGFLRPPIPQEQ